jgi:hypothetical protein
MADDAIFPDPAEPKKDPGDMEIKDGEKFITCIFIEPNKPHALPSGRMVNGMRIYIDECLTRLYYRQKARDN